MVNSHSSISPQLEQALSTVVDKRSYQNALKALELAEGDREAAQAEAEQLRNLNAYLATENAKLKGELVVIPPRKFYGGGKLVPLSN